MEDKKLNFIELCKIKTEIDNNLYNALAGGQAKYIADFFKADGSALCEHLQQIEFLGLPAYAIFVGTDVCGGLCDPISRLFVLASQKPDAQVVTGISKKIAATNYDNYRKDSYNSHHTWAEMEIGGVDCALDFTDQVVMPRELYYSIYQFDQDRLCRLKPVDIADENCIAECFIALSGKIQYLTGRSPWLMEEYDRLFAHTVYNQDMSDVKKFMAKTKEQLQALGMDTKYPSQGHFVCATSSFEKTQKMIEQDNPISQIIDAILKAMYPSSADRAVIKQGNDALKQVFSKTQDMHTYIANLKQQAELNKQDYQLSFLDDLMGKK